MPYHVQCKEGHIVGKTIATFYREDFAEHYIELLDMECKIRGIDAENKYEVKGGDDE